MRNITTSISLNLNHLKITSPISTLEHAHFGAMDKITYIRGPSIYDVHTEGVGGSGSGGRMWTGGGGPVPCGRPHRKLKLKATDVILSSYAKKLASFLTRISSLDRKK